MNEKSSNWQEVGEETVTHVGDLLRLDARNPPGNEVRAAQYVQTLLATDGIAGEIVDSSCVCTPCYGTPDSNRSSGRLTDQCDPFRG